MKPSDLLRRDAAHVWHPYTQMKTAPAPLPIVRGEGVYLFTEQGQRLLDGISSWWVNIHGHAHPELNAALARQAGKLEHVMFAGCTHGPAVELAERLVGLLPQGLSRVFYSDNGSTAIEVAVKMAVQYWRNVGQPQRSTFVVLHHAYHGDTVAAMSVSEASVFTEAFTSLLFPVVRAHAPYCFQCPLGLVRETCAVACVSDLDAKLRALGSTVAGVVLEPMLQGAGGMIVWPAEFLEAAGRVCRQQGVLLIADEVLTGFGRTGRFFACEHAEIVPDMVCLSKAITAGYLPMGATVVTEAIYEAFLDDDRSKAFFHGHSYTANPLACAVALASLDLFRDHPVLDRVGRLERQLREGLGRLRQLPLVGDVRVIGGVGAVELCVESPADKGYLHAIGPRLGAAFLERGLLLRPLGNVLYFMPPYVITDEQVSWALEQIEAEIRALAQTRF